MKLSNDEFWGGLRESAGLYARAVRLFKKEYDVDITRIAVRDRALKDKDQLQDIREESLDIAEEGLHSLMATTNETVKLRAIDLFLKTQGKGRGYVERQEVDVDGDFSVKVEFVKSK
jgi:hypothetical protein|tara:strand:+ start:42 stop:392 length:351 start_codon:yes stop_codon:yes gene_type:complete